jgi:hypothetical protein
VIIVFFASIALLFSSFPTFVYPGGDARGYLGSAQALVRGATADLRAGEIPFRPDDGHVIPAPAGEIYTIFPVGQSLALIPFYTAGLGFRAAIADPGLDRFVLTLSYSATAALLYAVAALLLYLLLRDRFAFSPTLAGVVCCVYAFGTMAFPNSKSIYAEPLQAALLMAIFYFTLRPPVAWTLPAVSACFSFLVLSKPVCLLYLPAVVWLLWDRRVWEGTTRTSIASAVGLAVGLAMVLFAWNYVRTGDIFDTYGKFQAYSSGRFLGRGASQPDRLRGVSRQRLGRTLLGTSLLDAAPRPVHALRGGDAGEAAAPVSPPSHRLPGRGEPSRARVALRAGARSLLRLVPHQARVPRLRPR